jgi:hypothetical protein
MASEVYNDAPVLAEEKYPGRQLASAAVAEVTLIADLKITLLRRKE